MAGRAVRGVLGVLGPLVLLVAGLCTVAGCSDATPVAEQSSTAGTTAAEAATALQPSDVVDLTVYFRKGTGEAAHLVPVTRDVPVADQLPRRAAELLLAGPEPSDGKGLAAPLPTSTAVLGFSVEDDVAKIDLSHEVITERASVGASAEHELLALAALGNTLTEFPEIEAVDVTVGGRTHGRLAAEGAGAVDDVASFWGWWGLPDRLHRDDSVVGPSPDGAALPDVARFGSQRQSLGTDETTVRVDGVRERSRATFVRVTVELADPAAGDAPAQVPTTTARATPEGVLLEIDGITAVSPEVELGGSVALSKGPFESLTVRGEPPGPLEVLVAASEPHDFWLHTLPSPTRVVLDLRK